MYILITLILIAVEIAILIGLVKVLFIVNDLIRQLPEIQETVLENIISVREELKALNKKLDTKPVSPLNSYEFGQIFGQTLLRLLILRKFSPVQFLTMLFKNRNKLAATFSSYKTACS